MFSVQYTGTNFLPLCTAIVWPTMSGWMVERRDQVRITFLSLAAFIASIFTIRCVSMNGPFFVERAILFSNTSCARYNESREEPSRLGFALLHSALLISLSTPPGALTTNH